MLFDLVWSIVWSKLGVVGHSYCGVQCGVSWVLLDAMKVLLPESVWPPAHLLYAYYCRDWGSAVQAWCEYTYSHCGATPVSSLS